MKPMKEQTFSKTHRMRNLLHSVLFLAGMGGLLTGLGYLLLGLGGSLWALGLWALAAWFTPNLSGLFLRMQGAQVVRRHEAPSLVRLVERLSEKAALPKVPTLVWLPHDQPNAFAMGSTKAPILGITQGLLDLLSPRELEGVLAHEISHIKHGDLWLMGLADGMSRMTRVLSFFGKVVLFLGLPLFLLQGQPFPWMLALLLLLAPTLSVLMQLALSRTREFEADLGAAHLTQDPLGLASALRTIERASTGFWWQMLFPSVRREEHSWLQSHPDTASRIAQLRYMQEEFPARVSARRRTQSAEHPAEIIAPSRWRTTHKRAPRHPFGELFGSPVIITYEANPRRRRSPRAPYPFS